MAAKKAKKTSPSLTAALAAESERFRMCVAARRLLPSLKADVGKLLKKLKNESAYAKRRWYRDWQQQLEDAGFQFARHLTVFIAEYTAFTNPDLGFDAFISEGNKPCCEVVAYHDDQTVTTAANFAALVGGPFAPPSRVWHEFKGASPAELVGHLKDLVRGKKLLRIDASGCAARFTEVVNRTEHETGERALHILQTATLFIDGAPPRWERLGYYCDFEGAGSKNPRFSTADWVRAWQDEFAKADSNPPDSTDNALRAAIQLVAASHLQFASAPNANDLLAPASDVALAHFRAIAGVGKKEIIAAPSFQFQALLRGLLLCALAGRWETFKEICNLVQPALASANTADDENLDFAQVLLLLVSSYRDRPLPKAAALEQAVAKRLAKVPRLHLDIWRAIVAGRAKDVEKALRTALEYFMELRGDRLVPAHRLHPRKWNNPFHFIALPESLFYLVVRERALELPPLEPQFADMLITPETVQSL
jgi:hypothetical protein